MAKLSIVAACYLLVLAFGHPSQAQLRPGFTQAKIADELDPTRMVIANDGRIFIAEKYGAVRIVSNGVLLEEPLITIPVDNLDERGLSGIVLDPDFGNNQFFYLYYSVPGGNHNRISRFQASGNFADVNSEEVLMELDGLWWQVHNGGAMVSGKDNKLYIATGDGANPNGAQSLESTLGKILRINFDGTIPEDNPYYAETSGKFRAIYAMGFRNPFTMAIHPSTGKIFINDVGNSDYEEVNAMTRGKNYGWPLTEGFIHDGESPPDNYKDPLYAYSHSDGCAVTGATFYAPDIYMFPENYHNKFFFADYCFGYIKVLDPETGTIEDTLATDLLRPIDLIVSPDGSLYYLSRGYAQGTQEGNSAVTDGALWKISYTGDGSPFFFRHPEPQFLVTGETAKLSVQASGAEPLTFQWMRNGADISGANGDSLVIENVTLADSASVFSCRVENAEGQAFSTEAVLAVTSNTRPALTIISPAEDALYKGGDTVVFKGYATDAEDGSIPLESLTWKIDFHHNTHLHPSLSPVTGIDSSSFQVPVFGETSANVWYRIHLTATDANGLTKSLFRDIHPQTSTISLLSDPPGLLINLDGQPTATPEIFEGVVNFKRSLFASPILKDDENLYMFENWGNKITENPIMISTPSADTTITAHYTSLRLENGTGLRAELFNQFKTFYEQPDHVRIDPTIDFNWGIGSPEPGIINTNEFTIRWTGFLKVPLEDEYTFYLRTEDGSRLWINSQLIIDNWEFNDFITGSEKSGTIKLQPGEYYKIRVEYYESQSLASARLFWSSAMIPKSIIPQNQFFQANPQNKLPEISFVSSQQYASFVPNEEVVIKASVLDEEDGELGKESFTWRVDSYQGDFRETIISETSGLDSVLFTPILKGDKSFADQFYRVHLIAVDFDGGKALDSIDVLLDVTALWGSVDNLVTFPNPAQHFVNVTWNENAGKPVTYELLNIFGQTVQNIETDSYSITLDLKGHSPGLYFLRAKSKNLSRVIKILKN